MNILTISTLADKGGAAYIAKTLHSGFHLRGLNTKFLAGYGKNGFPQRSQIQNLSYARYRLPIIPHLNFLFHRIFGKDIKSPISSDLKELVRWSDVIICHTLHSHFLNFERFFKILSTINTNKKVIMVAHDSWHYTGRCAIVSECTEWKNSCTQCPLPSNYPSSLFVSNTQSEWQKKIKGLNAIPNLTFVAPSKKIGQDLEQIFKKKEVVVIRNGIDIEPYKDLQVRINSTLQFCVSSVNLMQEGKVNLTLIKSILDAGFRIHFIGKNNPFSAHPNAIDHGYIKDRKSYLRILNNIDCYLFSSNIDVYPTVMIDSLCAGNFIFYTPSSGAAEIMNSEKKWIGKAIESLDDILKTINRHEFQKTINDRKLREEQREEAVAFFNKERMINKYLKLMTSVSLETLPKE